MGLPDYFVIYHGPTGEQDLRLLLDAWSWAAGPIGHDNPLVILGLQGNSRELLSTLTEEYQLNETLIALEDVPRSYLPYVYKHSAVIFHPTRESPWCGPLRLALACGKPVVASETILADALVGPAAYLIKEHKSYQSTCRALGAALVSVVVEEDLAESLSTAARQRALTWKNDSTRLSSELGAIYARTVKW